MTDATPDEQWREDRTTFQRVYDSIVGMQSFRTVQDIAARASCSETGAREALEQLVEMGIAQRRDGRPAQYRRNDAYLTWKRIEMLAREQSPTALRSRVDSLIEEDETFQARYGVPDPDAVTDEDFPTASHETLHEHWEGLSEWRTVRRDIRVLRRAVQRAETRPEDGAQA
jgi:predicted transcriptional regulator